MSSYKKLILNSAVFALGNLGSKLISFLLVPLYTYFLTTEEYGTVDLVTTTTSLFLPIISANIYDSVLRFTLDKNESKEKVLSNSLVISIIGVFFFLLLYPLAELLIKNITLIFYLYSILILQIYQNIFGQYIRAIGRIRVFAINGIIMTLIVGFSNIILLTKFHFGIDGYLWSIILSNVISILFLILRIKVWQHVNFKLLDVAYIKQLLWYSLPIIPNSIMWWLVNASNRYFILYFAGASVNGIYAAANKIPSLLSLLSNIFSQAWQLSAIEEYENENKSTFYSNVFEVYSSVLFIGAAGITILSRLFMQYFVAPEYYSGWQSIPFLLLSVCFSSFSGFLGTNYLASKKTNGVFKTSVYGGGTSLIANIILVPQIGIVGASLASVISFAVMWIIRIFDTKQFVNITINIKIFCINIGFILLEIVCLFALEELKLQLIIGLLLFLIQVSLNSKVIVIFKQIIIKGRNKLLNSDI